MMEPTIWMQLGISDERYRIVSMEIESILKTKETTGNLILMVRDSTRMTDDEKAYAVYMIAKRDIARKLGAALPLWAKDTILGILNKTED